MEYMHNSRTHEMMKQTPFYLMGGYNPKPFPLAFPSINILTIEQRIVTLQRV
jgi:hypothetical protein